MKQMWNWIIILAVLALSAACAPQSAEAPEPQDPGLGQTALVEEIELVFLESFPVQVNAILRGNLPDGCTQIERVDQELKDNVFQLTVITSRPQDAICTLALAPFEERVPLAVKGLPAGEYTVRAGDAQTSFVFEVDNVFPGD